MQPPRFTLRQLGYFVATAECGSIREASERLNLSQAALSQALGDLEREVGAALLARRRAHGVALTPAGRDLVGEARAVLEAAASFQVAAEGLGRGLVGRVRIDCYATLAPVLVPRLIRGFQERLPDVVLETGEGSLAECQARLRNGACDLALLYDYELDEDVERETLYVVAPSVVLPAGHRLAGEPTVDLAALADEPLILFDAAPASRNTAEIFAAAGVELRVARRSTNFELVRALVARGLGYSVLLQTPRSGASYEGLPLVTRPVAGDPRRVGIVAAWARVSRPSRRLTALRAACRDVLTPADDVSS